MTVNLQMGTRGLHCVTTLLAAASLLSMPVNAESGWDYGKRGLEWSDTETGSYLWLGLRAQLRYDSW